MLQQVCTIRNAISPLHRLPAEVLARIFAFTILDPCQWGGWVSTRSHVTVILGGICRHWRSIALSYATLWSHIAIQSKPGVLSWTAPVYPTKFAEFCLERSRSARIQLEVRDERGRDSEPWRNMILAHSSRITELQLDTRPSILQTIQWDLPNLTHLNISPGFPAENIWPHPLLFQGVVPQLRNVTTNRFISWPPGLLANLTSIELREGRQNSPGAETISTAAFLDLLDRNPLLEKLKIIEHGPIHDGPPGRIVVLSQLSSLSLHKSFAPLILSHLDLPSFVDISIWCTLTFMRNFGVLPEAGPSASMDLLPTLPYNNTRIRTLHDVKSLECNLGPEVVSLEFTNSGGHTLTIGEFVPPDWDDSQKEPDMYLEMFKAVRNLPFVNAIDKLTIGPRELEGESIISATFPEEEWISLFKQFPSVKSLILQGTGLSPAYSALAPAGSSGDNTELCPHLETLVIKSYSEFHMARDVETWFEGIMEELLEFTRRRYNMGYPLRAIDVRVMDSGMRDDMESWRPQFSQFGLESLMGTELPWF